MIATCVSREIAPGPRALPVTAKLIRIIGVMRAGKYERGVTPATFASEWGCSVKTVENLACEASHILDLLGEPQRVQEWGMVALSRIVDADDKDRVAALRLAFEASGLIGSRARNSDGGNRTMSLEDLKVLLGPLGYEIVEKGKTNG